MFPIILQHMQETSTNSHNLFIIAGMPRAGTTYLFHQFNRHPDVFVPVLKEANFFSTFYGKGPDWYDKLYQAREPHQYAMDASPSYFFTEESIERILEYDPNMKVILSVRSPASFAVSIYKMVSDRTNDIVGSFEQHLEEGLTTKVGGLTVNGRLVDNFVPNRVERFREAFGENLMLYDFEAFCRNPLATLRAIEEFVGIPQFFTPENIDRGRLNASGRRDSWLARRLRRNPGFVLKLFDLFPHGRFKRMHYKYVQESKPRTGERRYPPDEELMELAEAYLGDQQPLIDALFAESDFVLGDGTPLHKSAQVPELVRA